MKVVNVHQRVLRASPQRVAALLETLGSPGDQVWPRTGWPRMVLDRPLAAGAKGGHGPIRYVVEACEPGFAAFRFTLPGVEGWHGFDILDATSQHCVLEHRIEATVTGITALQWLLVIRPLHDACVEDALTQVQLSLGLPPHPMRWSPYVRALMRVLGGGRRRGSHGAARHAG